MQTMDTPNLDSIGGHASPSMRWKYMTLIVRHMCMTQLSLNTELDLLINPQEITSCLMKLGIVKINREFLTDLILTNKDRSQCKTRFKLDTGVAGNLLPYREF